MPEIGAHQRVLPEAESANGNAHFWRQFSRLAFFILFLLAPVLDLFRYDLTQTHFIVFGHALSFDLTREWLAHATPFDTGLRILTRLVLPFIVIVATGLYVFWRWGRIYCGWLCPHFSVVELINGLMRRVLARVTVWEPASRVLTPMQKLTGSTMIFLVALMIAALWALAFLSYLLPPLPLYQSVFSGTASFPVYTFLGVVTTLFTLDFMLARHLFCRFGCALGLFQSLLWMMNPKSMLVKFDRERSGACRGCTQACDDACPMRLPTRGYKRSKFTCTQCGECIAACSQVQASNPEGSLLHWANGEGLDRERLIPTVQLKSGRE